jgi:hypothetical protein
MTSGGRTQDSAFESALKRAVATRVLTSFNDTARRRLLGHCTFLRSRSALERADRAEDQASRLAATSKLFITGNFAEQHLCRAVHKGRLQPLGLGSLGDAMCPLLPPTARDRAL